jgi:hypothetical protein
MNALMIGFFIALLLFENAHSFNRYSMNIPDTFNFLEKSCEGPDRDLNAVVLRKSGGWLSSNIVFSRDFKTTIMAWSGLLRQKA